MVTVRTALVMLFSTCALAACGGNEPASRGSAPADEISDRPATVQARIDLEREAAGPPDAGSQAGHRGGGAQGRATSSRFEFTGTAQPSDARVTVDGADAQVDGRGAGVFVVRVRGLRRGATELTVRATAPGLKPWSETVTITRR
jgi:hypothetical protein